MRKIKVTHFQRKQYPFGAHSVEYIFSDLRQRLGRYVDFRLKIASRLSRGIFNRLWISIEAIGYQSDVNHITGDIHFVSMFLAKRRTVLTVLDCVFLEQGGNLKQTLYRWFWLTIPAKRVNYMTAISEATKRTILANTNFDASKIYVIPIGVSEVFVPHPKIFNDKCPVLLHIGTTPNKNLPRTITAISGVHCRLVIIGKIDPGIVSLLKSHNIDYENRWNLSAQEMLEEYKCCDIVTFVSTYEGFGMPIIEANFVERAVVAGNNSSMIEVSGNAACLVDAISVEDIREGILKVINDVDYRELLIANGRVNRLRFSPARIAEQYLKLYQRIYKENTH